MRGKGGEEKGRGKGREEKGRGKGGEGDVRTEKDIQLLNLELYTILSTNNKRYSTNNK